MKSIAHIRTKFPDKFGVPRQSGIVSSIKGKIVFEPEYRRAEALSGLEGFSHIWLIWGFSQKFDNGKDWSPTVRPPRLGGNTRLGVFATRSPNRPNPIGLSCVKLDKIAVDEKDGPVIYISGADMIDNTPIYDIKPYLPYVDCIEDAVGGFTEETASFRVDVEISQELKKEIPTDICDTIVEILANDPRPSYHTDIDRVYGMFYDNLEIKFKAREDKILVCDIIKTSRE